MKFGFIYLIIASMSLSSTGILLIDYTTTPAEQLKVVGSDEEARIKVVSEFLSSVLDEYDVNSVGMSIILEDKSKDEEE